MEVGEGLIVGRADQDAKEVVIPDDPAKGEAVFFIADGHTGEKVPLKEGLEAAEEAISEARDAYLGYSGDIESSIKSAFSEAEKVLSNTAHPDAGTTLTMIVKKGKWAYIGWVGDSMPYGVGKNDLSIIEKMEPHHWPDRDYHYGSLLSRSLGDKRLKKKSGGEMRSDPDIMRVPWRDFLLATDGLLELFKGKEIVQFCRQHGKTGAARMLVREGKRRIKLLTEACHRGERLVPPDDATFLLF
ncbi:protein serine/threonine phosphatase 2C family protein [Candidatus Microgenomates bacterium]|nr:protein serine/threonine phosphatase 2C family protein [Candidatus Microgenomates bacterium]